MDWGRCNGYTRKVVIKTKITAMQEEEEIICVTLDPFTIESLTATTTEISGFVIATIGTVYPTEV